MRLRGRIDANQKALVAHAESYGASWLSMTALGDGKPDGILGYQGHDFKVEFKTEKGTLTDDQRGFISTWRGSPVYVVKTTMDIDRLFATAHTTPRRG